MKLRIRGNSIRLRLGQSEVRRMPNDLMRQWAETDQVGIEGIQVGSDGGALKILVEKDFECVESTNDESQEDAFPHPQLTGTCPSSK